MSNNQTSKYTSKQQDLDISDDEEYPKEKNTSKHKSGTEKQKDTIVYEGMDKRQKAQGSFANDFLQDDAQAEAEILRK
jgi:hypothetical protein